MVMELLSDADALQDGAGVRVGLDRQRLLNPGGVVGRPERPLIGGRLAIDGEAAFGRILHHIAEDLDAIGVLGGVVEDIDDARFDARCGRHGREEVVDLRGLRRYFGCIDALAGAGGHANGRRGRLGGNNGALDGRDLGVVQFRHACV